MFGFGYGPRKNPVFKPLITITNLKLLFFVVKSVSNKQVLEQEKFLLIKVLKKRLFCFEHVLALDTITFAFYFNEGLDVNFYFLLSFKVV